MGARMEIRVSCFKILEVSESLQKMALSSRSLICALKHQGQMPPAAGARCCRTASESFSVLFATSQARAGRLLTGHKHEYNVCVLAVRTPRQ